MHEANTLMLWLYFLKEQWLPQDHGESRNYWDFARVRVPDIERPENISLD